MDTSTPAIEVRGARQHNLRGVDLDVPHGTFTVVTGVSGSGKSSLAMDVICREGQRRFLQSLSAHARMVAGKLDPPEVESVSGLLPALAVDQRTTVRSPRSTVGTMSEVYDHLRLLFARLGVARCPRCDVPLGGSSRDQMIAVLERRFAGRQVTLCAPAVEGHRGAHVGRIEALCAAGAESFLVDGELLPCSPRPALDPGGRHTIEAVMGAVKAGAPAERGRLDELLSRALATSGGTVVARAGGEELRLSARSACPECGEGLPTEGPRLFSFNSPFGACPACRGLGVEDRVDPELLVADPERTLRQGALVPTTPKGYVVYSQVTMAVLDTVCQAHGFSADVPWKELSEEQRRVVLYGSDRILVPFGKHPLESRLRWKGITARPRKEGHYKGIVPVIEGILATKRNPGVMRFVRTLPCSACGGARLGPAALAVTFRQQSIAELTALTISELRRQLDSAELTDSEEPLGGRLVEAASRRLASLERLGLGYLTLGRSSETLSGGEAQRIRLATQVGGALQSVLYVLDEPSAGLHDRDTMRLVESLRDLRDQGNTVVVVEHHTEVARAADRLVDVGPDGGDAGGRVLASGPIAEVLAGEDEPWRSSPTRAALLAGARRPRRRRPGAGVLRIEGAAEHNLRDVDVELLLGAVNVVTGVSGAGKSTLVVDVLGRALSRQLQGWSAPPGRHRRLVGAEVVDKVISVDQAPIGRTPRSNAATYTKLFDRVRKLFASLPEAREQGFGAGHFSFNTGGGRCLGCGGAGVRELGLLLLGTTHVRCETCGGRRFDEGTLAVRYRGHSVHDVLELSVERAATLFAERPRISRILAALDAVGLGYLPLGQPSTTLSGGEAQRVKLASELARPSTGHTLYILDEPTVGLHSKDVSVLLGALEALVEGGNTAVVIEHDLDVVWAADRVIDLGPEGGPGGGRVVASGTPEELCEGEGSHTGRVLARSAAAPPPLPVAPAPASAPRPIELTAASTHNLKHVSASLPLGRMTVITGPSGSGKSSLAYDTLYAEAHGRFAESLSTHARRFVRQLPRPEVASATGLTPAVAIGQRPPSGNARSTVGTMTGVLDLLRVLFSRCGDGDLSARALSFNHSTGACEGCDGLGTVAVCDLDALVTHPDRPLLDGALDGTKVGRFYGERHGRFLAILEEVGQRRGVDFGVPYRDLDEGARRLAMEGTGAEVHDVRWRYKRGRRQGEHHLETPWVGFAALVVEEHARKRGDHRARAFAGLIRDDPCPLCGGERLGPRGRAVQVGGRRLPEVCAWPVEEAFGQLGQLARREDLLHGDVAREILGAVRGRLDVLQSLGLSYLTLDRSCPTLSSGEARRVQLAAQLGLGLRGVTYVLDEPTVGLHPTDSARLLEVLCRLRDEGNTLVVVEHDPAVVAAADHLIDVGPGAGEGGGRIVAAGPPAEVIAAHTSARRTVNAVAGIEPRGAAVDLDGSLVVRGARAHNLRVEEARFPRGAVTAVTGVSGSGKSTLVLDVLGPSVESGRPIGCEAVEGRGGIAGPVVVDAAPIGSSPLSTPASYAGVMDPLRAHFAATEGARELGLGKGAFAYAGAGGRCPECKGAGARKVSMDFLSDVWLPCERCGGSRYAEASLAVRSRGRTIAEVLAMSVDAALEAFGDVRPLRSPLELLADVGLGYIGLGQSATALSGGEGQRLKLAAGLAGASKGKGAVGAPRLYLLDEPSVGLHVDDVLLLDGVLHRLAEEGHVVVVTEHDPHIVSRADWVVDLGPGGGAAGGGLVVSGPPAAVAGAPASATGRALRH